MLTTALLTFTLGAAPGSLAPPSTEGEVCTAVAPAPRRLDVARFEDQSVDGTRMWGASATYALSSGDVGEAFLVIATDGTGEVQLMINGDIIAHTAIAMDAATDQPITTTWHPPAVSHAPELIAEMMRVDLPTIVANSLPQEFKCSSWAKKP